MLLLYSEGVRPELEKIYREGPLKALKILKYRKKYKNPGKLKKNFTINHIFNKSLRNFVRIF